MFKWKFWLRGLGLALLIGMITWRVDAQENPLEFDTPVSVTLAADDTPRWQFEAYRDDVITLMVSRTDGDLIPVLSLFDSEGELQAQIQGNPDANLIYRIPRFGQYIVQVSSQGETTGSFTLTLSLMESGRREFEQGAVDYGQPVVQVIDDEIPYHLWTFTGTAGQVVDINVEILEGNLRPVLTLTSPGGINLGRVEAQPGEKKIRLLAVRLPGNGDYEILVRRSGENFGFGGDTEGCYRLEVTLRNGQDATASTLIVDEPTPGRLTLDSPLARYQVETTGTFVAQVELSEPRCLVDLTIFSRGVASQTRKVGKSPLLFPIELVSIEPHIFEVAAGNCPGVDNINFVIHLRPFNGNPASLKILPENQTVHGVTTPERWLFEGRAGDIIRFSVQHDTLRQPIDIRIFAPGRNQIYRSGTQPKLEEILTLTETGFYIIEVTPADSPYLLHKITVGQDYQLFTVQRPVAEQSLDVVNTRTWRITTEIGADATLTVESPAGEIIEVARSTRLNNPLIEEITLDEPGRYHIRVYSSQRPAALNIREIFDFENLLPAEGEGKAILSDEEDFHHWRVPLNAGDLFKLRLENLTPGTPLPAVALLDETGMYIQPEYQVEDETSLELIGFQPDQDGVYTILVNNHGEGEQLTYRLVTDVENVIQANEAIITVSTPATESFLPTQPALPAEDFLTPALTQDDLAQLDRAEAVPIPGLIRGEILPEQRRQIWRLSIVRNQMVSFTATSLENRPVPGMTLLNAEGRIVIEHHERELPVNHLLYRTPVASTYYLVVTDDAAGGAYLLNIELVPGLDETIPVIHQAVPVQTGETVTGELVSSNETDTYVFQVQLNDALMISVFPETGDFAPQITLIGPRGNEISTVVFDTERGYAFLQTPRLLESGLYTVMVAAGEPIEYGRYTLLISHIEGRTDDGGVLDGTVYGAFSTAFAEDTWVFDAVSGESISLTLEPLEVSTPTGLSISLADSEGEPFYIQQALLTEDIVVVRDIMLPRTGFYQVNVSGESPGRYSLTLQRDFSYLASGDHAVAYGDTVSGVFTEGNVVDRWLLAGNQGDVIAVALRPVRGDAASVGFEVEAPDGTIVGVGVDNDTGGGARTEQIILPVTGIYTILAGLPDVTFSGSVAYDLGIERQNRTARSSGTVIPYNTSHSGVIYADDTRDIWLFEGNEGDVIRITAAGDGIIEPAFSLTAFNAIHDNGQYIPLVSRTGTIAEPARLVEFTLPATGAYAITVSGVGGTTGAYTLNLTALQQVSVITRTLENGQTQQENLKQGEQEIWTVQGSTGDVLEVTVEPIRRSTLAPLIQLISPDGHLLAQVVGSSGESVTLPAYTLPTTGLYRVIVQPIAGERGDTRGHYEIIASLETDNTVVASPLVYNDAAISALSDENSSQTWFFDGQAGDVVFIRGWGTSGNLDTVLTLYAPEGNILAIVDDTPPASTDAEITLTLPETGRYMVEIARFGKEKGYTSGNYRLDLLLLYRPGNVIADADDYLAYGERVTGKSVPEMGIAQTWYFVGKAEDEITIHLQFPAGNVPLMVSLYDVTGNLLQEGQRIREQASIENFVLPADGIYQIAVQPARRLNTGDYIPYSLSLDLVAAQQVTMPDGEFIQPGASVSGSFADGDNVQVWLYDGQAGEQLSLTVLRLSGFTMPEVTVFTPDGRILASISGNPERRSMTVPLTLPVGGVYQITVVSTDNFLDYRLAMNSGQSNPVAGQLIAGRVQYGLLSDAEPVQTWLFDGAAGQIFSIQATGNTDFSLRLENSSGAVLASSTFDASTGQVIIPPLSLPADDTYRIVVSRAGGILGISQGEYRLRVSDAITIPEALLAQTLISSVTVSGSVENQQKRYYIFYGDARTPISIEFTPEAGENLIELRILNESGQLITRSSRTIDNLLPDESGYYLIEISNPAPLTYTLTYAARPVGGPVELLERDVTTVGDLTGAFPVDYYSIEATAGESILIEVSTFANTMRTDLVVFDPDGIPLRTFVDTDNETLLGPLFIPRTGTYTLRVGTWLNLLPVDESSYSVRVRNVEEITGSEGGNIPVSGQPVSGGVSEADPLDQWTFEAQAGSLLSLNLRTTSGDGELSLELLTPDNLPLELLAEENGNSLTVENILIPENGIYTLNIRLESQNSSDATAYQLVVEETLSPVQNSLAGAQGMAIGEQVSGQIASPDELDAYVLFASQGQTITIIAEGDSVPVLTLISPNGTPLYASSEGRLEQILLLEDGLYSVVVSTTQPPLSYTLRVETDTIRANWRWTLHAGGDEQAVLTPDSPVHEWQLTGYRTGEYAIVVRPESTTWQARTFVLNETNQMVATGELQADGSTLIRLYLDRSDGENYSLIITSDLPGGMYQIAFDTDVNVTTPQPLTEGRTVTGRITPFDTADEWLWEGNPNEPISIVATRLDGDFSMRIRVFAPGNLFLQEFTADENGFINAENILLPVEGTYVIQVVRTEDVFSDVGGLYELRVEANPMQ